MALDDDDMTSTEGPAVFVVCLHTRQPGRRRRWWRGQRGRWQRGRWRRQRCRRRSRRWRRRRCRRRCRWRRGQRCGRRRRRRRGRFRLTEGPTTQGRAEQQLRPALRRCTNLDPQVFADTYWSRQPLLTRAVETGASFTDLLDLPTIDELLSRRGLRTPFLRIARDGAIVEPKRFTTSGGAGAEIADQVSSDAVLRLFADGSTVVLQGLHRLWPPLIEFADQLAADLGHPTQVNAYVTPPSSRGFSPHYDVHDVFVLQLAGEKHWRIHAPVLADPLRTQLWQDLSADVAAAAEREPVIDAVLRPGDALYLPRGYIHSAAAWARSAPT